MKKREFRFFHIFPRGKIGVSYTHGNRPRKEGGRIDTIIEPETGPRGPGRTWRIDRSGSDPSAPATAWQGRHSPARPRDASGALTAEEIKLEDSVEEWRIFWIEWFKGLPRQ